MTDHMLPTASTAPVGRDRAGTSGPPRGPGGTHPTAPPPLSPAPAGPPPSSPLRPSPRDAHLRGSTLGAAMQVAVQATVYIEEVEAGRRPAGHLRTLLDPALAGRWTLVARRTKPAGRLRSVGPVQLRRLGRAPVCSVVLLIDDAGATRPVGLELVLRDGHWVVTDVARPGRAEPPALPEGWASALSDRICRPLTHR